MPCDLDKGCHPSNQKFYMQFNCSAFSCFEMMFWTIFDNENQTSILFSSTTSEKNITKVNQWFKTDAPDTPCKLQIQKNQILCRPSLKAKDFVDGYITETQFNNNQYKWKVYTDAKGSKRWGKLKFT